MAATGATSALLYVVMSAVLANAFVPPERNFLANEAVCSNIDIRNSVEYFKKLENCTVIEGFLSILLIDLSKTNQENLSFPKLREITGYLLLYRAFGLMSLEKLFPNLTVIRGSVLFYNYALVVFEMFQLQEIGLQSLTSIVRGSVRIEKNPNLCYVDSIDWDRIAQKGQGEHFIKENKNPSNCPICPSMSDCPLSSSPAGKPTYLCWNSRLCQKVCSAECIKNNSACTTNPNKCCHQECLGGCTGTMNTDCIACKKVAFQGRCMKKCPSNTYEYMGRRCIEEYECKNMKNAFPSTPDALPIFWKPFNGSCLAHCPTGYMENNTNKHDCIRCKDRCPKICPSAIINSVASAQNLKGCTYINGSLEIQIKGGENVIRELEKNLHTVQVIRGYLKIARSFPIVSLNFLKELAVIEGEELEQKAYSFFVLENQNMQELWDWENRKPLKILKGKVFFHFNSKLCPSKIEDLKKYANVKQWDSRDVSPNSNGDRVACQVFNMNVTKWAVRSNIIGIKWDNFKKNMSDPRNLLGYVIYYREAPDKNITIFDGRDACGTDVWKVDDIEATDDHPEVFHLITHLKPFTQYAIYIRTYTLASGKLGAQSDIIFVRTTADTPSPPQSISAHSTTFSDIFVSWSVPKQPNGKITHYIVQGIEEKDSSDFINQRNYCKEPLILPNLKNNLDEEETTKNPWTTNNNSSTNQTNKQLGECCSCKKRSQLEEGEESLESQIDFEDFLHNSVYYKNPDHTGSNNNNNNNNNQTKEKEMGLTSIQPTSTSMPISTALENLITTSPMLEWTTLGMDSTTLGEIIRNETDSNTTSGFDEDRPRKFSQTISNNTMWMVNNLHHFTEYTVEVMACLDEIPFGNKSKCSTKAITTVRTLPLGGADDIKYETISLQKENYTLGMVMVHWKEPEDPNGLIVSYTVEYKRVNLESHKPISVCITRMEYLKHNGYALTGLSPGNYSLNLRATSLAGNSNWTQPQYFSIPTSYHTWSTGIIVVIIIAILAIIAFLLLGIVYVRKKHYKIPEEINYASINPEYMSTCYVYKPDEWEVERSKITLVRELGQGSFGMVYEGLAQDISSEQPIVKCAVKTVNESATHSSRLEFLKEASVMKAFDCHHVVKLLGVVSQDTPALVIMELMANGDLKSYLRSHRPNNEDFPDRQPPTLKRILQMAIEIADGMAYLSAKKFVHRDLAARNCMVASDLTVKIGDFGMTRDIYETDYYRKGGKGLLPVRWMAPESLKDGVFTSASDVWSYGVVLWEMATLATQPYQGLSNEQVLKYVLAGNMMRRPEDCPEKLYCLMSLCWEKRPTSRPSFERLIEMLLSDVDPKFFEVSFYLNEQRRLSATQSMGDEENISSATPLKEPSTLCEGEGPEDSDSQVQFFPNSTLTSPELSPVTMGSGGQVTFQNDVERGQIKLSNGSIPNGHVIQHSTSC